MIANIIRAGTLAFARHAPWSWCVSRPFQGWWLAKIYYRIWCPGGNQRVRDCIAAGECGCNNRK